MSASSMSCTRALLILLDAPVESDRRELGRARVHARTCPHCRDAYERAAAHDGAAFVVPEASPALRVAIAVVGAVQLVLAVPWLVGSSLLPDANVTIAHLTRDGALGLVIAVIGIGAAWRPRYAHGALLLSLAVFAAQVACGVADRPSSGAPALFEIAHVLVIVLIVGLAALAADVSRRATPSAHPRSRVLH